jgi:hypothetical protein
MLSNVELDSIVMAKRANNNIIQIDTTNLHSPTAAHHDDHLKKNTLEIRVYE